MNKAWAALALGLLGAAAFAPQEAAAQFWRRDREEPAPSADLVAAAERAAAFLAENAQKDGVTVTRSGLQYEILERGPENGRSPYRADVVRVIYTGTLTDGTEFDATSEGHLSQFNIAAVIKGWTEGMQLMREGDKFRFYIAPELAYGEEGREGVIGPNEALIFDVELVEVIRTGLVQN